MKLQRLDITREDWGENKGGYTARITYDCPDGEMTVQLSPEVSAEYLRLSQDMLNRFALDGMAQLQKSIAAAAAEKGGA